VYKYGGVPPLNVDVNDPLPPEQVTAPLVTTNGGIVVVLVVVLVVGQLVNAVATTSIKDPTGRVYNSCSIVKYAVPNITIAFTANVPIVLSVLYNVSPFIQLVILYHTGCKVVVVVVVVGPIDVVVVVVLGISVVVVVVVVGSLVVVVVVVGAIVVVVEVVLVLVVVVLEVLVVVVVVGGITTIVPEGSAQLLPGIQLFTIADPDGRRHPAVVATAAKSVILHPSFNPE